MLQNKKLLYPVVLALLSLSFIACDDQRLYDEYFVFENGWKADKKIQFSFQKPTTTQNCNLFLNIISNDDYPYSNLFLIVKLEAPTGLTKIDTLEYQMADHMGKLLGQGVTEFKENKLWYKENVGFPEKGVYTVSVEQAVREHNKTKGVIKLEGISKIGLRIESVK